MKKTKIWVLTGASLLILGALVWVIAMSALKWDFYALDTTEYTPMHYAPQEGEQITAAELDIDSFSVVVQSGETLSLDYYEADDSEVEIKVEDGILKVHETREFKLFNMYEFKRIKYKYVLTLPDGMALSVKNTNSTLELRGVDMGTVVVRSANADFAAYNCKFESLTIDGTNADVKLDGCETETLSVYSTNLDLSAVRLTAALVETRGTNTDVSICDSTCDTITMQGTNADYEFERVRVDSLFAKATNLDAEFALLGDGAEYTIETHGRDLPKTQVGTTDKKIVLSGTNNSVHLRFVA